MRPALAILLTLFAVSITCRSAEDGMRLVLLRMPAKDADAVRAELNDPAKGAKPETMDAVLKRKGATEVGRFSETDPWRKDAVELKKVTGKLGLGEDVRDLEITLRIEGEKSGDGVEGVVNSSIELPVTGKSYLGFSNDGHRASLRLGRWQESAAWEDSRESLTLWSFPTRDDAPTPAPAKPPADTLRVEMRWFKANSADLAQMAKAQPGTREKAALWLSGRATLWKSTVFRAKPKDQNSWHSSEGKLFLEDGAAVGDEESLYLKGGYQGEGDALKMDWKLQVRKMRVSGEVTSGISADVVPGKWDFALVEGVSDTNVLVYRFLKD